jgi:hypothetical protein
MWKFFLENLQGYHTETLNERVLIQGVNDIFIAFRTRLEKFIRFLLHEGLEWKARSMTQECGDLQCKARPIGTCPGKVFKLK